MAVKIKRPNPMCDRRYIDLVVKYRNNPERACIELFKFKPTWQQLEVIREVCRTGSMTTISSGHGTGKSLLLAALAILFIITLPYSRCVMVATKVLQLRIGLMKYISLHWQEATKRFPWLAKYFEVTATQFKSRFNPAWALVTKGFRPGAEESLAGEHAENLLVVVDEASGVPDRAFTVLTGALTQSDNRMCLISQPTRTVGYFFDTHHKLAAIPGNPGGIYTPIVLNSEYAPHVTLRWLAMKAKELGGFGSDEYNIKVRGLFSANSGAGFLLTRAECLAAQKARVKLRKGWGWLMTCDVGDGSDKSVLIIWAVSGERYDRRAVPVKTIVCNDKAVAFARRICAEIDYEKYPDLSIAIDGGGVGSPCCDLVEEAGHQVQRIRWGDTCFADDDKRRYHNQRAYSSFLLRDAINTGRCQLPAGEAVIEEGARIPVFVNDAGQHQVESKKAMRKAGISSPDIMDTCAYAFLASYVPARTDAERARVENEIEEARALLAEGMDDD